MEWRLNNRSKIYTRRSTKSPIRGQLVDPCTNSLLSKYCHVRATEVLLASSDLVIFQCSFLVLLIWVRRLRIEAKGPKRSMLDLVYTAHHVWPCSNVTEPWDTDRSSVPGPAGIRVIFGKCLNVFVPRYQPTGGHFSGTENCGSGQTKIPDSEISVASLVLPCIVSKVAIVSHSVAHHCEKA